MHPVSVRFLCGRRVVHIQLCNLGVPARSSSSASRNSIPSSRPPSSATVIHKSQHSSQNTDHLGASGDYSFFGNISSGEGGRTLIYTGSLNSWIHRCRLFAGAMTVVPLVSLPWILEKSVVTLPQLLPWLGVTSAIPWIVLYVLSKNYVTKLYRYPPQQQPGGAGKSHSLAELFAFETRNLWGARRETVVPLSRLRYKPGWVTQVWETVPDVRGKKRGFFVDPNVVKGDPLLGGFWEQIRRQSPKVAKSDDGQTGTLAS
ncbi:hypothetical protein SpCBS45565_g02212 [Spizellomyces sp. 'palustris']|nr:hypothetical protein SpCBS45565_g02212 [Spizellomyces sp. 'palustris']